MSRAGIPSRPRVACPLSYGMVGGQLMRYGLTSWGALVTEDARLQELLRP